MQRVNRFNSFFFFIIYTRRRSPCDAIRDTILFIPVFRWSIFFFESLLDLSSLFSRCFRTSGGSGAGASCKLSDPQVFPYINKTRPNRRTFIFAWFVLVIYSFRSLQLRSCITLNDFSLWQMICCWSVGSLFATVTPSSQKQKKNGCKKVVERSELSALLFTWNNANTNRIQFVRRFLIEFNRMKITNLIIEKINPNWKIQLNN